MNEEDVDFLHPSGNWIGVNSEEFDDDEEIDDKNEKKELKVGKF